MKRIGALIMSTALWGTVVALLCVPLFGDLDLLTALVVSIVFSITFVVLKGLLGGVIGEACYGPAKKTGAGWVLILLLITTFLFVLCNFSMTDPILFDLRAWINDNIIGFIKGYVSVGF